MARERFLGFCGGSYTGAAYGSTGPGMSSRFDSEHAVNFYPTLATKEGSPKSPAALVGRPGLSTFVTLGASPCRGVQTIDAKAFAVGGTHFYDISNGTIVTDYGAMAGSTGVGMCQIVGNGNGAPPSQVLVMDSSVPNGGQLNGDVFIASGGVMTEVVKGSALAYMDGFFFVISSASGDLNKVYVSALLDGTSWNALNFVQRTGSSDRLMQLGVLNNQLWMFGQKTTEVWYNAGNPTFPLARIQGGTINIGILTRFSLVRFRNTMVWVGADEAGYASVYLANGLQPIKASNPGVEYILFRYAGLTDDACIAYGYEEAGHTFYCMNLKYAPNFGGGTGMTLCYDLTTGLWHERYYSADSGITVFQALPNSCASYPGLPGVIAGDYNSARVYNQALYNTSDNGAAITYIRQTPLLSSANAWTKYPSLEVDADVGTAQIALKYSNDGGKTFPHSRAAISASNDQGYGSVGAGFGRFIFRQMGRARIRSFRVIINSSTQYVRLVDAYIDKRVGSEG